MPKHVGVLTVVMYCILLCAFVGGYTDCKNIHSVNHIKSSGKLLAVLLLS